MLIKAYQKTILSLLIMGIATLYDPVNAQHKHATSDLSNPWEITVRLTRRSLSGDIPERGIWTRDTLLHNQRVTISLWFDGTSLVTSSTSGDTLYTYNVPNSYVLDRLEVRRKSFSFFSTMRSIQEPLLISGLITDWTFGTRNGYQKKPFILDADVQTPLALGGKEFLNKKGKWLSTFHLVPHFKVRIFRDDEDFPFGPRGDISLPVRTPSTMPWVAYYGTWAKHWDRELTERNHILKNLFVGVRAFHHSNGQDGWEFDTLKVANAGKVNHYNGNFGENLYFEVLIGSAKDNPLRPNPRINYTHVPGKQIYKRLNSSNSSFWKLGYEFHPSSLTNNHLDQYDLYGRFRLNYTFIKSYFQSYREAISDGQLWYFIGQEEKYELLRWSIHATYIMDPQYNTGKTTDLIEVGFFDVSQRLNAWITGYYIFRDLKNLALFAQLGRYGSDVYNIYFNQSMWQIRGGIAFGFFDSPNFKD